MILRYCAVASATEMYFYYTGYKIKKEEQASSFLIVITKNARLNKANFYFT